MQVYRNMREKEVTSGLQELIGEAVNRRLSVTNLSSENSLPMFRLNVQVGNR